MRQESIIWNAIWLRCEDGVFVFVFVCVCVCVCVFVWGGGARATPVQVEVEQRLSEALFTVERLEARVIALQHSQDARMVSPATSPGACEVSRLEGRLQAATADNAVLQQALAALRTAHVCARAALVPSQCPSM